MTSKPLKQPSQRNQRTESNDLPAKLALPPHPASSLIITLVFFHYNNLIDVFALFSVRNFNKFSFDILTNFQQSFVSMFCRKTAVKNEKLACRM